MNTGAIKRFILAATALATLSSCSPRVTVYEDATVVRKGFYYDNTAYLYRYYVIVDAGQHKIKYISLDEYKRCKPGDAVTIKRKMRIDYD